MIPENFNKLLTEAKEKSLYKKLIVQLKKDFSLTNIETDFLENDNPDTLKTKLQQNIYKLIHHNFDSYINLLYRIDVSEKQIKNLKYNDAQQLVEQVSFLILYREWQKVNYKHRF